MSVDEGGWKKQKEILRKQFPMIVITSTFRNNSVADGGGRDYHSRGLAVDIALAPTNPNTVFDWIRATYPNSSELIFSPRGGDQLKNGAPHVYGEPTKSGHYDHIHWAMDWNNLGQSAGPATGSTDASAPLGGLLGVTDFLSFATNPGLWARVAAAIGAVALVIIALIKLSGHSVNLKAVTSG